MNAPAYPWLLELSERFDQVVAQGRLSHALLLSGPKGAGKSELTQLWLRRLLAVDEKNTSLLDSEAGHPDCRHIMPEGKQPRIKIDMIRQATAWLVQSAQQGGNKVLWIEQADTMTVAAANALLKALEEPVGHTYLLLTTARPQHLLPTIRSRCEQWCLKPALNQEMTVWLKPYADQMLLKVPDLWRFAEHAPLALAEMVESQLLQTRLTLLKTCLKAFDPMSVAKAYADHPLVDTVDWFLMLAQDCQILQRTGKVLVHTMLMQAMSARLPKLSDRKLHQFEDFCLQLKRDLYDVPALQPRLMLEQLLLHWRRCLI